MRRLDRLISDISDLSRLDAELTREDAKPMEIFGASAHHRVVPTTSVRDDTRGDGAEIAYSAPAPAPMRHGHAAA